MTRDEIRRLVGGYATGTLTESERAVLMQAALEDQDLFDELAREQELKEMIEIPGVRGRLVEALRPAPKASWITKWQVWAGVSAAAAALVVAVYLRQTVEPVQIAQVPLQSQPEIAPPAAESIPQSAAPAKDAPRANKAVPQPYSATDQFSANSPSDRRDSTATGQSVAVTAEAELADSKKRAAAPPPALRDAEVGTVAGGPVGAVRKEEVAKVPAEADAKRGVSQYASTDESRAQLAAARPPAAASAPPAPPLARIAGARAGIANVVAFRYSVNGSTLTVTPQRAGFVSVAIPRANTTVERNATAGKDEQFAIPQGTSSVVVTFATGSSQQAQSLQKQQGFAQQQQQTIRQRSGTVSFEPAQDSVSVEIQLP